jgi:hypothetical protein
MHENGIEECDGVSPMFHVFNWGSNRGIREWQWDENGVKGEPLEG